MKRIVIAAVMATAASYGALAQEPAPQPDPNAPAEAQPSPGAPDTSTAAPAAKPDEGTAHPPANRMDQATPTMKAPDPAESQAGSTTPAGSEFKVTEEEAKNWIGKTVYSSDGKNLGEVGELVRGSDDKVTELQADIGGFLGIGETRVRVSADKIQEVRDDSIVLSLSEADAKALPAVEESASDTK